MYLVTIFKNVLKLYKYNKSTFCNAKENILFINHTYGILFK